MKPITIISDPTVPLYNHKKRDAEHRIITELKKQSIPLAAADETPGYAIIFDLNENTLPLIEQYEADGIPTSISPTSRNAISDKWGQHLAANTANISTPQTLQLDWDSDYDEIVTQLGTPFVIKPNNGSHSIGVELIHSVDQFYPRPGYLAQKSIGVGTDLTIVLVGREPVIALQATGQRPEILSPFSSNQISFNSIAITPEIVNISRAVAAVFDTQIS